MLQTSGQPWDLITRIYDFLLSNPWSLILVPIVWIVLIYILTEVVDIYVSAWTVLICFIASLGIVIGIVAMVVA